MRILLDTNVLCRLAEKGHPLHSAAENAVATLRGERHELCLVPQVVYEYWVVVTRPASVVEQFAVGQPFQADRHRISG